MNDFEDIVRQVYFHCDTQNINPKGLYGGENLDLLEFASKLIAVWEARKDLPALLKK
jgi:hypothetical protein